MTETTESKGVRVSLKTIGEIVAEDYRTASVFEKHGIDFCCGGQVPLASACRAKNLDVDALQLDIEAVKKDPIERSQNYAAWSLTFLADYIINTHHAYLNEEMETIAAYVHKIADVHGARHPELFKIKAIFDQIVSDMEGHLREEEDVFFPAIKRVEAAQKTGMTPEDNEHDVINASLEKLNKEHDEVGAAVHEIHHLANDYSIPEDACNSFVITYTKLKEFEDDLHRHVHLENNLLFPKAARL